MVTNIENQGRTTDNTGINTLLDTLKSQGMKDQTVVARLNSLNNDPNELARLSLQEGLLNRIISLDPSSNPNIDPQQAEELKLYLQAAHYIKMDEIEEIKEYFGKIKLPKPAKKPKTFSRRAFAGGVATGLAAYVLAPRAINALITPSEESAAEPAIPTPPEPEPTSPPTSTFSPQKANIPTNVPSQAKSTATVPPLEAKPTLTTPAKPKPTNSPSPVQPSPSTAPATATKPPQARPTVPPAPEQSKSKELESSITSEILINMLEDEATKRRAERRSKNPAEYDKRVNAELNKNRVNIVLFGYGAMKWYEAGGAQSTQPFRGSQSILSIDTRTGKIDVITPTGQTIAPEVRKHQLGRGEKDAKFDWVDKAYHVGGFELQRLVIENMTGLSADFQVVLQDSAIKTLVDQVFQGLKMDVPSELETMPFMLDGIEYPEGKFQKGEQILKGVQTVQYIKALAKSFVQGKWILDAEPNPRKHHVFKNMMKTFEGNKLNLGFWLRLKSFLDESTAQKKVETDIDAGAMILSALSPITAISFMRKKMGGLTSPNKLTINKTIFMQDPNTGADGGVSWIQGSQSPHIKKAVQENLVAVFHNSVPSGNNTNPFSDNLVDDYWKSTRELVRERLTGTKQESVLYPAELSYQQTKEWIGKMRNSHDEVLTESLFLKEIAGLPENKQD